MAELGFVGPVIREKVEVAIGKLDAVMACSMDGL